MSTLVSQLPDADVEEPSLDHRRELVQRIVASQGFAKSERLSSFLICVCDLERHGKHDQINEQYIGMKVFGRRPDYDPGVDSIVRSHASRLRHRLAQYFSDEGTREALVLTIPKGSYLPVFHMRPGHDEAVVQEQMEDDLVASKPLATDIAPAQQSVSAPNFGSAQDATASPSHNLVIILSWALAAVSILALVSVGVLVMRYKSDNGVTSSVRETNRIFWSNLFNGQDQTLVVSADSGLVMLQNVTGQPVSLATYMNGTYITNVENSSPTMALALNLATRRYTSIVDLEIASKILRMVGVDQKKIRFVYSRDVRPSEIKQGNVILLGTYESTPWVQLFEPGMNFYFRNNLAAGVFSAVNRNPLASEQPAYNSLANDPEKTVYGVVAYRPSLDGSGKVLILEGQSMAGTESAADFVFNDGHLLPFLKSIQRADGTIPYFELLVRSTSISGEASRLEVIAKRIEEH